MRCQIERASVTRHHSKVQRERHWTYKHGHGNAKDPTYRSWRSMKMRVLKSDKPHHVKYYKGMHIHPEWLSFAAFLRDMGVRPAGTSLDRIDNSKGYEPGNCRWSTSKVQGSNRTCVENITFNGKTQNAEDWARELGLKPQTIRSRLDRGWPLEDALTAKAVRGGRKAATSKAKLNVEQVRQIRKEYWFKRGPNRSNGKELAARYGVDVGAITSIIRGDSWRNV